MTKKVRAWIEACPTEHCPACDRESLRPWFRKQVGDDAYGISRCEVCKSAFVLPRPGRAAVEAVYCGGGYGVASNATPAERLKVFRDEEERYPNSIVDAARIAGHCAALTEGRRLLDIGAGLGACSFEAKRRGFSVTALEPAPECREVFSLLNGFDAVPSFLSAEFAEDFRGQFDVVVMSQVLEHVPDLEGAMRSVGTLLSARGIAAIAVPRFRGTLSILQGRKDMFITPPEHVNFFTPEGLERLFARHGFRREMSETVSRFDAARARERIRFGSPLALKAVAALLSMSDRLGLGMYSNAYFRKA